MQRPVLTVPSKRALPGSAPAQMCLQQGNDFSSVCERCGAVPCTNPEPHWAGSTQTCPQLSSACRGGALLLLYLCSPGVLWASARHSINYPHGFQRLCLASSFLCVCREGVWLWFRVICVFSFYHSEREKQITTMIIWQSNWQICLVK